MSALDTIKSNLFSTPMPDMPPILREVWQAAYMLRRKYSDPTGKDAETYFAAAWSDANFIANVYGHNETVLSILGEVYLDIERQWKVVQKRLEKSEPDP